MVHVETGQRSIAIFNWRAKLLSKNPFVDKENFCPTTAVLLAFRGRVGERRILLLTPEERMVNPD